MRHFSRIPPEVGFLYRLFNRQGPLKSLGIGYDVNEFGKHLRCQRQRFARVQHLMLKHVTRP